MIQSSDRRSDGTSGVDTGRVGPDGQPGSERLLPDTSSPNKYTGKTNLRLFNIPHQTTKEVNRKEGLGSLAGLLTSGDTSVDRRETSLTVPVRRLGPHNGHGVPVNPGEPTREGRVWTFRPRGVEGKREVRTEDL